MIVNNNYSKADHKSCGPSAFDRNQELRDRWDDLIASTDSKVLWSEDDDRQAKKPSPGVIKK